MKMIKSFGGPLIGLHRSEINLWSGADGKSFIGESSPFPSDYEAGGVLTDGRENPPCNISKIIGEKAVGLLISMPLETALVDAQETQVCIAQVHYAPHEWVFSAVNLELFEVTRWFFDEHVHFVSSGGKFAFFDSAYSGNEITDNCLEFNLQKGIYVLSSKIYNEDEEILLTLCRIALNE